MRDFSNIKFVSNILLDATAFNKKKFKYSQIWHVSEGKPKFIKDFAKSSFGKIKKQKENYFSKKKNYKTIQSYI